MFFAVCFVRLWLHVHTSVYAKVLSGPCTQAQGQGVHRDMAPTTRCIHCPVWINTRVKSYNHHHHHNQSRTGLRCFLVGRLSRSIPAVDIMSGVERVSAPPHGGSAGSARGCDTCG